MQQAQFHVLPAQLTMFTMEFNALSRAPMENTMEDLNVLLAQLNVQTAYPNNCVFRAQMDTLCLLAHAESLALLEQLRSTHNV